MSRDLLPEHHADRVLVVELLALDAGPNANNFVVLALQPQALEVLVLFTSGDGTTFLRLELVRDKEVCLLEVLQWTRAIQLLCDAER